MIRNFKDKETQKIFERQRSRKLPSDIQQVALRKLRMLNRSQTLQELRINQGNLAKVLVMIPPINLQKEFAQRVSRNSCHNPFDLALS